MSAPLRNILLFFVFLLSLRLAQMCVHYPWYTIFTLVMNYGPLCKYAIMFMSMLEYIYLALLLENINNNTLDTFRWNATMIAPCAWDKYLKLLRNHQGTSGIVARDKNSVTTLGLANRYFWRHCWGWIQTPFFVVMLRNANKHFWHRCQGRHID